MLARPGVLLVGVSYFQTHFSDIAKDALRFDRALVRAMPAPRPKAHEHSSCAHGGSAHQHGHGAASGAGAGPDFANLDLSGGERVSGGCAGHDHHASAAVPVHTSYWVPATCAGCGVLVGQVELKRDQDAEGEAQLETSNVKLFKHRLRTSSGVSAEEQRDSLPPADILSPYTLEVLVFRCMSYLMGTLRAPCLAPPAVANRPSSQTSCVHSHRPTCGIVSWCATRVAAVPFG